MRTLSFLLATLGLALAVSLSAQAATPREILTQLEKDAGAAGNPQRGEKFFSTRQGTEWSCASCHTEKPTQGGLHATTNKPIKPLAPAANAERFTDPAKVEKWFRRNCNDVLKRVCTPQEKADVLAWLITVNAGVK